MKQSFFYRGELEPLKYVSFYITSSMVFAEDTLKILNLDLGSNAIFGVPFFWMKKLIISFKSTGKILFIIVIPPYSTYRIHKSSYLLRLNPEFVVLRYICIATVELMRFVKGCVTNILILLVTSRLLFLLHYLVQIHIFLRFRD